VGSPWQQVGTDQWVASNKYAGGVFVYYDGKQYKAKWNVDPGEDPPGSSAAWELIE